MKQEIFYDTGTYGESAHGEYPRPDATSLGEIEQSLTEALAHNWDAIKGLLKAEYLDLTDQDLVYVEGREDELIDRIQKKTCRPREEIENIIVEELRLLVMLRHANE